jgi:uncharacterized membrane protein YkoI
MRSIIRSVTLGLVLGAASLASVATTAIAEQTHHARCPLAEARAKALGLVPGRVVAEELEHEQGRWIYSFEIRPTGETRKIIKEVNLDADTGALVGSIDTEND